MIRTPAVCTVRARVPEKQGLKPASIIWVRYGNNVRARVPEKQGLKLSSTNRCRLSRPGPGASSRKTRIETCEGVGGPRRKARLRVRARVPEKQGLKLPGEDLLVPGVGLRPGASSRKTRIETIIFG